MNGLMIALVSFASGLLGSLGMGAGAVLLLYLRVFAGMPQLTAQGVNLIFFLPIALFSVVLHTRHKLIAWKTVLACVVAGIPAVLLGVWLGGWLGGDMLSKLFGGFLLLVGWRELFQKK